MLSIRQLVPAVRGVGLSTTLTGAAVLSMPAMRLASTAKSSKTAKGGKTAPATKASTKAATKATTKAAPKGAKTSSSVKPAKAAPTSHAAAACATAPAPSSNPTKVAAAASVAAASAAAASAAAASAAATLAGVDPMKSPPARSFQLDKILEQVSPTDLVFAKQEGASIFSFLSFKGLSPLDTARRILAIPEDGRNMHAVFGRQDGTPLDFAADLDFPFCKVGAGDKGYYTGESIVLEVLQGVQEFYKTQAKVAPPTDIVVLDGGSRQRHSFHVHVRSPDAHFTSFQGIRDAASWVNSRLPFALVDIGVYRPRGTMRVAYCPKFTEKWRSLTPLDAQDPALQHLLKDMGDLTKPDIVARSFIANPGASGKVIRGAGNKETGAVDEFGNKVPKFLLENKKWVRYGECTAALSRLPDSYAEDYHSWIRIGLSLHAFAEDSNTRPLNDWKNFSARCRAKFNPAHCDALWVVFGRRPGAFNWRRGYFYMTRKVTSPDGK